MTHFSSSIPCYIRLSCLLRPFRLWEIFKLFLVWRPLTTLRSPGQVFCRLSFSSGLSDAFSQLDWGYGLLEGRTQRSNVIPIIAYERYMWLTWLVTVDVNLDPSAELAFVSKVILSLPLPVLYSLDRIHYVQLTFKERGIMLHFLSGEVSTYII